jgi:hypothetical protein
LAASRSWSPLKLRGRPSQRARVVERFACLKHDDPSPLR